MPVPHCLYWGEDVQWIIRLTSSQAEMSLLVATLWNVEWHADFLSYSVFGCVIFTHLRWCLCMNLFSYILRGNIHSWLLSNGLRYKTNFSFWGRCEKTLLNGEWNQFIFVAKYLASNRRGTSATNPKLQIPNLYTFLKIKWSSPGISSFPYGALFSHEISMWNYLSCHIWILTSEGTASYYTDTTCPVALKGHFWKMHQGGFNLEHSHLHLRLLLSPD